MSNFLLVLLWVSPEAVPREVRELAAYVGTVYTADAVNYIIKSLYDAYTYVDTVVVYGPDFTGAGEYLVRTLRGECTEALRLPCQYVKELNVAVVDLRWGGEAALREAVGRAYRPRQEPARPRREVALERPNKRHPVHMAHVIYDVDLEALRAKALDYVLTYGVESGDVLYNVLVLQRANEGDYTAALCDLLEDWPCGLDRHAAVFATCYVKKRDFEKALALLRLDVFRRDVYDPHGNFVLGDKLYHYSPVGVLLREVDLSHIGREAAKLLPDHAFYLGREYAARLLLGKEYKQDKWMASATGVG